MRSCCSDLREREGDAGRRLGEALGVPVDLDGRILREAIAQQTPLGQAAQADMKAGRLVPDEMMIGWSRAAPARTRRTDSSSTGSRARRPQAEALDAILKGSGGALDRSRREPHGAGRDGRGAALEPVALRQLRRHLQYEDGAAAPGRRHATDAAGPLMQREDDAGGRPQAARGVRPETAPLVAYYRARGPAPGHRRGGRSGSGVRRRSDVRWARSRREGWHPVRSIRLNTPEEVDGHPGERADRGPLPPNARRRRFAPGSRRASWTSSRSSSSGTRGASRRSRATAAIPPASAPR